MKPHEMLVAPWLLWLAGCADTATNPPIALADSLTQASSAVRITLNPAAAVIRPGGSVLFVALVRNAQGEIVSPDISWRSSDTLIARVSQVGMATGALPGEATITATCLGAEQQARVRVQERLQGGTGWSFLMSGVGLAPLYGVWASSPTDVFAVGSSTLWDCCGVILHYDGLAWSYMPVPDGLGELLGVWGTSASDVFAVGRGSVILHYDGSHWNRMPLDVEGSLEAVWGTSATDVYAVGETAVITSNGWHWRPLVLHYDGVTWEEMATPQTGTGEWLVDVWGTGPDDIFAVGSAVLHYDGTDWGVMTSSSAPLFGVWGSAPNDVFAVGKGGVILHYDGSTWQTMPAPPRSGDLMGIRGISGADVYAVGDRHGWGPEGCCSDVLHYDGATWQIESGMTGQALFDVWATPDEAFIVGAGPTIIHGTWGRRST